MENATKKCPKCGEVKPPEGFSRGASWCRACYCERAKAKYRNDAAHRERMRAYARADQQARRDDPELNEQMLARLRVKRETNRAWREETTAKILRRRSEFVGRDLAIQARSRAARKKREYTITPDFVQRIWEQSPTCVYCGAVLAQAKGCIAPTSPTIDRIDTTRGYTPDNVALACFRCNTLKRDATLDELKTLVANIERVVAAK
jgi:hypothetical protein